MRLIALAAVIGLAGACAPNGPVAGPEAGPETGPETGPAAPQTCDASGAQRLVGSHVGAVDFAAGANVRIVCTTCPTTRDYRPDRLNVRFNQSTGIIERVDCG